jgi:1,4-alpha-glucan branching enzyme
MRVANRANKPNGGNTKDSNSKAVELSCKASEAKAVFIAGTFNNWNPNVAPMHSSSPNGKWTITLQLPPGHHEYKYVVDGQWCCEPGCESGYRGCPKCVPNDFGTMNRVLDLS